MLIPRNLLSTLSLAASLMLFGCGGGESSTAQTDSDAVATNDTSSDSGTAPTGASETPSDAEAGGDAEDAAEKIPFEALYEQGLDRYLGLTFASSSVAVDGGGIAHSFDASAGPMCFTGNEFVMSTRDGSEEDLMIFLEGGGGCGPGACNAVDITIPGVPRRGIMDPDDPANPAAGFDMAYVPYCDGTLFIGDTDVDSDGDGMNDRFFRGLQNLSASLNVIHAAYPAPRRILLAGNSAGGLGVHFALPLVRKLYPSTPIDLVNDSGVGIYEPGTVELLVEYWNGGSAIPADCADCIGEDGNLTGFHDYQLDEDAGLRVAFISSRQDEVITGTFGLISPEAFEAQLLEAVDELVTAHPDRFASLIAAGEEHTFIQRQFGYVVAGTTVREWIADMLDGSPAWTSLSD